MKRTTTIKAFWIFVLTFVLISLSLLFTANDASVSAHSAMLKVPCGIIVEPPTSTSLPTRTPAPTSVDPDGRFDHILPGMGRNEVAANPCPSATPTHSSIASSVVPTYSVTMVPTPSNVIVPHSNIRSAMSQCALPVDRNTFVGFTYAVVTSNDGAGLLLALSAANANTSSMPYTIYLDIGHYLLTHTATVAKNTNIWGRGLEKTFVEQDPCATLSDGSGMAGIMTINAPAKVELHNVTFQNGVAKYAAADAEKGGAIVVWGGILDIYDSRFENNIASKIGGAIFNNKGTIHIDKAIFKDNYAKNGGALYFGDREIAATASTISCTRFKSNGLNRITGLNAELGGAIFNSGNLRVQLSCDS